MNCIFKLVVRRVKVAERKMRFYLNKINVYAVSIGTPFARGRSSFDSILWGIYVQMFRFLQAFILQSAHNWQSTAHVDRGLEITRVPDDGRSGCISY